MSTCWKKGKKTEPRGTAVFTHRQIKNAALGFVSCSATTCLFSTCQALSSVPVLKNSSGGGSSKPTWRATPLCLTGACSEEPPACHRTLTGALLTSVWVASMLSCYPRRPSSRNHLGLWIYLEASLCQLLLSETLLGDALPWECCALQLLGTD